MAGCCTKFPHGCCSYQAQSVWLCLPVPSLDHGQWVPQAPDRCPCGQKAVSLSCRGHWRHRRRRWNHSQRLVTAAEARHCSLQGRGGRVAQGSASFPWGPAILIDYTWVLGWKKEPEVISRGQSCRRSDCHLHQGGPGKSFLSSPTGTRGLEDPGLKLEIPSEG